MSSLRPCPICHSVLINLPEHLMTVHHVVDEEERKLLSALDHGRYSGALPCHQGKCAGKYKKKLSAHLEKHIELTKDERKELLAEGKKCEIRLRLKQLQDKKREDNSIRSELENVKKMVSDLQGHLTGATTGGIRSTENTENTQRRQRQETQGPQVKSGRDQRSCEPRDLPTSSPANRSGRMTIETLTSNWLNSRLHSNAPKKKVENCKQGVKYVMEYINMMASGEARPNVSLTYIDDPVKIQGWLKGIRSKYAIPTVKARVWHVRTFVRYVRDQAFNGVRLGSRRFRSLLELLKKEEDALETELLCHRQIKTVAKAKLLLSRAQLDKFRKVAKCEIPKCLDKLLKWPRRREALKRFVGWLAGYIFSISGHRKGVLTHMTAQEAQNPEQDENSVVISVAKHKTAGTFGQAGIVLTKEEYDWFLTFDKIRKKIPGYHSQDTRTDYFFFNSAGGEMVNLGEAVRKMFESIDMHNVTTNVIRASIATMAHRELSKEARDRVCSAMCHGVGTSSKWYVAPPSISEAFTTRKYVEHGTLSNATEISGASGNASERGVLKKKRSVVCTEEDKEPWDVAETSSAGEVTEKESHVVSSEDDEEAADAAELLVMVSGDEEEELRTASEVSAGQKATKRKRASNTEMCQPCMDNVPLSSGRDFICDICDRGCTSRIGLVSHTIQCKKRLRCKQRVSSHITTSGGLLEKI